MGKTSAKVHIDLLLLLIGLAALVGMGLFFVFHGVLNADEGFYLAASHFVSRGFRPYQDFGYTQGPLWPYVEVPWLKLFGETLAGQRFASLVWTLAAVGSGVVWLKKRSGWMVSAVFVGLLLGAPLWLAFAVKGKTYAFAALTVVVAAVAIQSGWRDWMRWLVFIGAATLGIGARLPTAGFFVPAGIGLLMLTSRWRVRVVATLVVLVAVAGALVWASAGDFDRLVFWTLGYHRASTFRISVPSHFIDCFRFAPMLWVFVGWLAVRAAFKRSAISDQRTAETHSTLNPQRSTEIPTLNAQPSAISDQSPGSIPNPQLKTLNSKPGALSAFKHSAISDQPSAETHSTLNPQRSTRPSLSARVVVLASLLIGIVLNLSAPTTYAEYVFPFFCALALVVAPFAADRLLTFSRSTRGALAVVAVVAGWNYPPEFSPDLLAHAAQAESFLRSAVPPGSTVAASMPEIPIAAGMKLPPLMAMGKFGLTEDFAEEVAQRRQMLTPESLTRILKSPDTRAIVFSPSYNWNFFWTLPSYRVRPAASRDEIHRVVREQYRLEFVNAEYVIYVRR